MSRRTILSVKINQSRGFWEGDLENQMETDLMGVQHGLDISGLALEYIQVS